MQVPNGALLASCTRSKCSMETSENLWNWKKETVLSPNECFPMDLLPFLPLCKAIFGWYKNPFFSQMRNPYWFLVDLCDHDLSVVRFLSLTFHIFSSETVERNSMKLVSKQDPNVRYQVCVFGLSEKQVAALVSAWDIFRILLLNCWTEFNESWHEARSQRPLPSLCFSDQSKKKMTTGPLIA